MRGIQILGLSSAMGAESDELVKDLENWFEDHQQMCRLITTCLSNDADEAVSGMDRLRASVDSGQRLLGRLKVSVQNGQNAAQSGRPPRPTGVASIPLSGMNRFDETQARAAVHSGFRSTTSAAGLSQVQQSQLSSASGSLSAAVDSQRILPSRTYLKKSGS
ncbi:MAG: hypothetical protein RJB13_425 [Pseudomonadota bacterium]